MSKNVVLIEWENYSKREPYRVELMSLRTARKEAQEFKNRRRRRADIIRLVDIK